jgi:SAM-dependent methyltransferase
MADGSSSEISANRQHPTGVHIEDEGSAPPSATPHASTDGGERVQSSESNAPPAPASHDVPLKHALAEDDEPTLQLDRPGDEVYDKGVQEQYAPNVALVDEAGGDENAEIQLEKRDTETAGEQPQLVRMETEPLFPPSAAAQETSLPLNTDVATAKDDGADTERQAGAEGKPAGEPTGQSDIAPEFDHPDSHSLHAMSGFSVGLSVDSDISDVDSSLGDVDIAPSSVSVSSSVYRFVEQFGRTYHRYKEGAYVMPNDEQEQNRLDLQHAIMLHVLDNKLHLAPIDHPQNVIDLGTGTGLWAIEFATQYPMASVTGTDLSPIQPEFVPPNCKFEIDDAEDEWIWSQKFDYIHARYFTPFLKNTHKLLRNAFDHLEPGGWFELQEAAFWIESQDGTTNGTAIETWNRNVIDGMRRMGTQPLIALQLRQMMVDAGFVDVQEKRIAAPINPWPKGEHQKVLGFMEMQNLLAVCHGIAMNVLVKIFGWSTEEVEVLLAKFRTEIKDRRIHGYFPM